MTVPTAPPRTPIPSTSRRSFSKYDLLQTIFHPSKLLVFPHPNPEAAVQTYLASLDAAHLYWDGVSSLSDYLLSIGVRQEILDSLVEMLEAGHPGLLRSISVEDWVMTFLEQDEEEDEKAYREWVEAEMKRQQQDSDAERRLSKVKELTGAVGETDPAASVVAGLVVAVV